eukprot:1625968-Alexandrium_andersonii.AAC.1
MFSNAGSQGMSQEASPEKAAAPAGAGVGLADFAAWCRSRARCQPAGSSADAGIGRRGGQPGCCP